MFRTMFSFSRPRFAFATSLVGGSVFLTLRKSFWRQLWPFIVTCSILHADVPEPFFGLEAVRGPRGCDLSGPDQPSACCFSRWADPGWASGSGARLSFDGWCCPGRSWRWRRPGWRWWRGFWEWVGKREEAQVPQARSCSFACIFYNRSAVSWIVFIWNLELFMCFVLSICLRPFFGIHPFCKYNELICHLQTVVCPSQHDIGSNLSRPGCVHWTTQGRCSGSWPIWCVLHGFFLALWPVALVFMASCNLASLSLHWPDQTSMSMWCAVLFGSGWLWIWLQGQVLWWQLTSLCELRSLYRPGEILSDVCLSTPGNFKII